MQLSPQPNMSMPAAEAGLAATFKQLRYRTYTLQRSVDITRSSIERLAAARLYVLIDGRPSAEEFQRLASSLIAAGVHVLQLRDKRLGDRELLDRARLLAQLDPGDRDALRDERSARRGGLGPGRRGSRGPGGAFGEGRPLDRRPGRVGGRIDPQHRAGPAGGPRRGQLHRRGADVSLGHEAVLAISGRGTACGRWRRRFVCPPSPSAASVATISTRCWRPASRGSPSAGPSPRPPTRLPPRGNCSPRCGRMPRDGLTALSPRFRRALATNRCEWYPLVTQRNLSGVAAATNVPRE